jgi:hypothetical protein
MEMKKNFNAREQIVPRRLCAEMLWRNTSLVTIPRNKKIRTATGKPARHLATVFATSFRKQVLPWRQIEAVFKISH